MYNTGTQLWSSRTELWSSHEKFHAIENELEGGRRRASFQNWAIPFSLWPPFPLSSLDLILLSLSYTFARFLTCEWNTKALLSLFCKRGSFSLFWSACAYVWLPLFLQTFNRHPRADTRVPAPQRISQRIWSLLELSHTWLYCGELLEVASIAAEKDVFGAFSAISLS